MPVMRLLTTSSASPPPVRIEGPQVYLRPARPADWQAWAQLRAASRTFLTPWEPTWPNDCLTRASFTRRLRRQATEWRDDIAYSFLVFEHRTDTLLGGVGLSNVRRGVAQIATMGYWIGARFARHGFMTSAASLVLDFAFETLALHRVEAACLPHNDASRNLLEKLGFEYEGYARDYLRINGDWQDHLLFAMLREAWHGGEG